MFTTVAVHHVAPEHAEAFLAFMHRVEEAVRGVPGLVEFGSHRDVHTGRLVGIARWESAEAFQAALPVITSLGSQRLPEWTVREDELLALTDA